MGKFTTKPKSLQKVYFTLLFEASLISSKILEGLSDKFTLKACSSVDRASDSDSESQGFDSLHAYKLNFHKNIPIIIFRGCFGFDIYK